MSNQLDKQFQVNNSSSPDRLKDFDPNKQQRWREFSANVIKEIGSLLSTFPQLKPKINSSIHCPSPILDTALGCTYALLASKRKEIAIESQTTNAYLYGTFNQPGERSEDSFDLLDLPFQKEQIYKQLKYLTHEFDKNGVCNNDEYEVTKYLENYHIHKKLPPGMYILFNDHGVDSPETHITIERQLIPKINSDHYFSDLMKKADPYFKACLAWHPSAPLSDFLIPAGKLSYFLAHLQPVGNGNAAITEWLVRALAKNVGLELGPFNHEKGIGWDFKAFFSPNPNDYAEWYTESAFTYVNFSLKEFTKLENIWQQPDVATREKVLGLLKEYIDSNHFSWSFFSKDRSVNQVKNVYYHAKNHSDINAENILYDLKQIAKPDKTLKTIIALLEFSGMHPELIKKISIENK